MIAEIAENVKKALVGVAMEKVVRERLDLALDLASLNEKKVEELQIQLGSHRAEIDRLKAELKAANDELQQLKEEHAEEVLIEQTIEFRRGKRTRGNWLMFCPKCHLPAHAPGREVECTDTEDCGWSSSLPKQSVSMVMAGLPQ